MSQFKVSKDCLIDKTEQLFTRKLLSGDFIIGADKDTPLFDRSSELILENVFRYNKTNEFMEIYKILPIENKEQYCIALEFALDITDKNFFKAFIQQTLINYGYFFLDKHKNIGAIAIQ